jgi:hypothetical protein
MGKFIKGEGGGGQPFFAAAGGKSRRVTWKLWLKPKIFLD